jgi:16S rRNA (cytidine1402-2'-O)-methyltransferase
LLSGGAESIELIVVVGVQPPIQANMLATTNKGKLFFFMDSNRTGTLSIVATPIGNLGDMVPRAVQTLQSVDLIACEDTRHSKKLLDHFGINTSCIAYHDHGDRKKLDKLLNMLADGRHIALISDAGTPLISDPGYRLVAEARSRGFNVLPIPGACAAIATLSVSGLPTDRFYFGGFLPVKSSQRQSALSKYKNFVETLIFYEAPHRILDTIADMIKIFGEQRHAFMGREISKAFETYLQGSLIDLQKTILEDSNQQRGEIVLVISGQTERIDVAAVDSDRVLKLLLKELPASKASSLTAKICGGDRKAIYQTALSLQGK